MANKKFSEFDLSVNVGSVSQLVGLNGTRNVKITPTNLLADVNSDISDNTQAITDEENARILADIVLQDAVQVQIDDITGSINQPNGIAGLNPNGRINNSEIPTSLVTDTINSQTIVNGGNLTSDTLTVISQLNVISNLNVSNQAEVGAIKSFSLSTFFTIPPGTPVEWYSFNVPSKSGMFSIEGNGNVAIYHFTTASDGELRISETPIGFFGNQDMQCFVVNYNTLHIFNFFFEPFAGTLTLKILYLD